VTAGYFVTGDVAVKEPAGVDVDGSVRGGRVSAAHPLEVHLDPASPAGLTGEAEVGGE